ncbi:MAG: ATP-binding protein [Candidatus Magnetomorum sp.]|nr:ATP-binding protein [Candidatus Magnetomorum sp.]
MKTETSKNQADQVWTLFKETERRFQETDQKFQETDRKFKETDRLLTEQFQKTDRLLTEQFQKTDRLLTEKFQETDRMFKETAACIRESSKKTDQYLGKVREFDRNWGKLVESLVAPSMVGQFQKINMEIDGMTQRIMKRKNGKNFEIDILLTNSHIVIPVEVKTKLNVEAVNEHIEKHLIPFKMFFPEYRDRTVYGAVAYIHVEEGADRYAYKKGLYVLTFGDNDMVVIKNDNQFKPIAW